MAAVSMTRTVEVVLEAERGGRERRNVIHYHYDDPRPTVAELEALANDVANNVVGSQQGCTTGGTTWNRITATDIDGPAGATASVSIFRAALVSGNVLPGNVSICLTKRTGIRGGAYRGRFYLFDLNEAWIDEDSINIGALPLLTGMAAAIAAVRTGIAKAFTPAVGSRTRFLSTPIQSITFDLVSDSQRRRLTGRGR